MRSKVRAAIQLDPGDELEQFQEAARTLIAYPLVTRVFPHAGALPHILRFEEPLRNEFRRLCHWRLDVSTTCARLMRWPAQLSPCRPALASTESRRPLTPRAYAYLCLVLASLEGIGKQSTVSHLADAALRLCAGDAELELDLTQYSHRKALVDAVLWLQKRGVLRLLDGATEAYLSQEGDALYDVESEIAGRLLVSPPSAVGEMSRPVDFLQESYPPTPEGESDRTRHRVHRLLLMEPVVHFSDLSDGEREYVRQRRTRLVDELERLTGASVESRSDGMAMVGLPAAQSFPSGGCLPQAALLLGCEMVLACQAEPRTIGFRALDHGRVELCWQKVVDNYSSRFTTEYRAEPLRLRADALALLDTLGLIRHHEETVLVSPAMARYRPQSPEQPSLMDVY